jgi:hypothetical protein
MDHGAHAILMLTTAIFVTFGGLVVLALGWRRAYRGERSGLVLGDVSPRQTILSFVGVPAIGLSTLLAIAVVAAALR